jgi:hypothetical protein
VEKAYATDRRVREGKKYQPGCGFATCSIAVNRSVRVIGFERYAAAPSSVPCRDMVGSSEALTTITWKLDVEQDESGSLSNGEAGGIESVCRKFNEVSSALQEVLHQGQEHMIIIHDENAASRRKATGGHDGEDREVSAREQ